ncbi:MAG: hypothetical protein ACKVPY_11685 [Paracoccaceae bacterium]
MIVARQPGFLSRSDDVLLSADGRTVLARAIEFVCFNDRYVLVWSLQAEFYGLFDALADPPLQRLSYADAMAESGLAGEGGCGGHYRGMVGSSLLYDGNTAPFLPPCDWRNFRAKGLKHREWFDRPCES